jgi:hypothetical protein
MRALVLIFLVASAACAETRVMWKNERAAYIEHDVAAEACEIEWIMAPQIRLARKSYRGIFIECMASYGWRAEVWEIAANTPENP